MWIAPPEIASYCMEPSHWAAVATGVPP